MLDDLIARQHGRARHTLGREPLEPSLCGASLEDILCHLQPCIDILIAQSRSLETWIVEPLHMVYCPRKSRPFLIAHHRGGHKTVLSLVDQIDEACCRPG